MSDPTEPLDWIKYAEEDWMSAKKLLRGRNPSTTNSCFHAQQAAEKYLKAILISKKAYFPKTHDLSTLNMLCSGNSVFTGFSTEALTLLTDHAVNTRYPGDAPTMEDAKEAIEIANSIRKFVRTWFGLK
jgi:HEPN domain-containing protein